MKRRELRKMSDAIRRKVSRSFGFRQSDYINWIIKENYFFCLKHLSLERVYLEVKPMYADELWWDIFNLSENKKCPISLRGIGAFSIHAMQIKEYVLNNVNIEHVCEEELREEWQNIFRSATQDIDTFLHNNPNANTFIPNKNYKGDSDRLLYFISLLHNGKKEEVVKTIKELKAKGHNCLFYDFNSGMDSYDCILKWCKK